jgi:hypothetical protein
VSCFCLTSPASAEPPPAAFADELEGAFGYNGFGIAVTVDQPAYSTDFPPPNVQLGDKDFPVIKMSVTAFNNSSRPVTYLENCYKFKIYNSLDIMVWEKSACRPEMVTLNPGASRTWSYHHPFMELSGDPMPEDLYTLRGELEVFFQSSYFEPSKAQFRGHMGPLEGKVSFWHTYDAVPPSETESADLQSGFDIEDFGAVVTLDESVYFTKFMPPNMDLGDGDYPVINMDVRVFNNTETPVKFTQECYHFKIFDSDGVMVWEINFCNPERITLGPGDSVVFTHSQPFSDEYSFPTAPMPEGLYTLQGTIELSFPETSAGRALFESFSGIMRGNVSFFHAYTER